MMTVEEKNTFLGAGFRFGRYYVSLGYYNNLCSAEVSARRMRRNRKRFFIYKTHASHSHKFECQTRQGTTKPPIECCWNSPLIRQIPQVNTAHGEVDKYTEIRAGLEFVVNHISIYKISTLRHRLLRHTMAPMIQLFWYLLAILNYRGDSQSISLNPNNG